MKLRSVSCKIKYQGSIHMVNDINSLAPMKWNCKYHMVFAPKYRRKIFYSQKRAEIWKILRQLCDCSPFTGRK